MTQTFLTNANNDLYLGVDGNLVIGSGIIAVQYACKSASLTQLGECVLQTLTGLPNFQVIWVGVPNLAIYENYLRNTLLAIDGVVSIISLSASYSGGVLRYTSTLETEYGNLFIRG